MLIVPKVFYDYCTSDVLTIEWMDGTPVSDIAKLKADGIDLHKLADYGVEIFFTQVFRDGFFHADMHPGNILVAADNRYIALDFGIVGTLTDYDKRYLAINFLAFFQPRLPPRRHRPHESGWVPCRHALGRIGSGRPRRVRACVQQTDFADSFGLVLMRLLKSAVASMSKSSRSWYCCKKRCSTSEGLGSPTRSRFGLVENRKPFWCAG